MHNRTVWDWAMLLSIDNAGKLKPSIGHFNPSTRMTGLIVSYCDSPNSNEPVRCSSGLKLGIRRKMDAFQVFIPRFVPGLEASAIRAIASSIFVTAKALGISLTQAFFRAILRALGPGRDLIEYLSAYKTLFLYWHNYLHANYTTSGTTGMVAKELLRRWVVMDISRPYLDEQAKVRTGTGTPSKALDELPLFS